MHLSVIEVKDMFHDDSNKSELSAPDKEVIDADVEDSPAFVEKMIQFQMTFRDSGCGIS